MKGKHVLVVDDDPVLRDALQADLEERGHAVETAENGRVAVAKLDLVAYDALLLDFLMPEVDGLAVLRHVRQFHPSLPVVMMTGERNMPLTAESFVALGARGCLVKPFDVRDIEQIVQGL